ncbi:diguanylate cyclase [Fundidesulfovibrio soli]|uniref:diguanylate cyclase n=1 Tax=Fundidesulfovibrio soli TaxID=2922716 RepID=UPI001FAF37FC|nr:diguanylate cyclase [Fundidesulfovibrio soli]
MAAVTNRPRVLVVDDMPLNIKLLRELLKNSYAVSFATDGHMALALAESSPPDLVLLDISMPEMDGYEVCRRLKANPATRAIPVVFLTAQSDETNELEGLSLGAIDYITKPFSPPIVLARVKNHIEFVRAKNRLNEAYTLLDLKNQELDDKNRALEVLLQTDRLTRLHNRHKLDEAFQAEVLRAKRYATQFSVILLDVDSFKTVNDTFGHLVGDSVLVQVADTLSANVREMDMVGRWGGEEFLLLCPETGLETAAELASRLRSVLACQPLPPVEQVTASFGVAAYHPGDDVASLLRRADDALYRAKASGRNRVEIAPPPGLTSPGE